MSVAGDIIDALAAQLASALGTAEPPVQVAAGLNPFPTPPSIDVYPADPYTEQTAYGFDSRELFFTVRARVNGDQLAQQGFLLELMGPSDDGLWVDQIIAADRTLGTAVAQASVADGPTGFRQYADAGGDGQAYLGCEWRVRVIP